MPRNGVSVGAQVPLQQCRDRKLHWTYPWLHFVWGVQGLFFHGLQLVLQVASLATAAVEALRTTMSGKQFATSHCDKLGSTASSATKHVRKDTSPGGRGPVGLPIQTFLGNYYLYVAARRRGWNNGIFKSQEVSVVPKVHSLTPRPPPNSKLDPKGTAQKGLAEPASAGP